ncbi:hypothetical protein [Streptomyces sp. NPDC014746]|uniref:hypothetical protein n=1 Tax=Streptomyces sp. NPDC014746 TaxID=3364904 RepID=UPI0037003E35
MPCSSASRAAHSAAASVCSELLGRSPGAGLDPGHGPELTGWFRRTRWDPASPLYE